MHGEAGKDDWYRPVNREKYGRHHDRIFGKKNKMEEPKQAQCDNFGCGSLGLCPECRAEELTPMKAPLQEFQKFPKKHRLYRDIIITEKIDGTNGQIFVPEDPVQPLWAGSRKRWITPTDDNFGFAAWVRDHEDELRQLGPGHHYGEWWGAGIQRKYGLDHRRFSLFNVSRWRNWLPFSSWGSEEPRFEGDEKRQPIPMCCSLVPILYAGEFTEYAILNVLASLRAQGSCAAPGFDNPEGIVISHRQSGLLFKVTLEGDEKPKGKQNG